ncbi:hypothetical protein SAMN05660420_00962 [Desulfuromusa kysingii]|uniref:Lipoprotein n=1 Tax=Desulfuromusa kysingii TaxID=37625 RepID=A0A1H3XIG6_9BACT|nr:hypothetical protein [Desulfuromusa kysingii]SDZ98434.1 hypothetical protein SAMN05660420_00962 [Desulfuromusa kysingii]
MKRMLYAGLLIIFLAGCGSGTFQVPKQEYQSRVQVLGVLPLLVDTNSNLKYPQRDNLFAILTRSAEGKHEYLVEALKEKKGYFDVRSLSVSPELTALSLLSAGSPHDESGHPLGYAFDATTVAEIARTNVLDAVLVVVFSGEQIEETRRSRTKLETLTTQFSDIRATAAVVDRQGQVLWELAGPDSFQALVLQYADFDEAYYNKTNLVRVKNVDLSGVERFLAETPDKNGVATLPRMYQNLFSDIASGISPNLFDSLR